MDVFFLFCYEIFVVDMIVIIIAADAVNIIVVIIFTVIIWHCKPLLLLTS